ncbi:TPA: hypothetical protein N0F65_007332 [Lagenidium giganteum]|uniref:FYVE-type domain-containing protein n=1 Tax=Lagenidium giganteum TaxID=4803 RepID=A0AAV2Z6Q7_9STRA|nr:TPA: hypothetical protein N0F65_007332 [Lagenidium giganteum]
MDDQERGEWVSYGHEVYARFVSRVQQLEQGKTRLQHQRGLEHADKAEGKRVSCMEKRRIYGSFPELADLYLNDKKKVVLDFSESKCLVPLLVPTEQSPNQYVGLRWSKVTSPTRLAQDRDYCYIEVMKPFVDARGRTAWAKCSHSVRYPGCPENPAMIRGQIFHSGIIFRETSQPGLLEATFYYDCDTRGIPSFLAPMVLKSRGKNNAELINHYLKMARMATSRHDNPLLQTSVSDLLAKEKRCGSCSNRLPRWRSKEKCHYCRATPIATMRAETAIRFAPEKLDPKELHQLTEQARAEFQKLFQCIRFISQDGALGARVADVANSSTRATICSAAKINATIDEVADIFFSDHTHLATGFAQSQQIVSLLEPDTEHPLRAAGVRWSLWDSPSRFVRKRDLCYIEYMDVFEDDQGRRGWARCTRSVEHKSCPNLTRSHSIVRAEMYCSGSIYKESDTPGVLDVMTLYDVDTRGIPAWLTKMVALRKSKNAERLEHLVRLARIMANGEDPNAKYVQISKSTRVCRGCSEGLSRWKKSKKCRRCNDYLCKSCSQVVYTDDARLNKLNRICVHCVDDMIDNERGVDSYADANDPLARFNGSVTSAQRLRFISARSSAKTRHRSIESPTLTDTAVSDEPLNIADLCSEEADSTMAEPQIAGSEAGLDLSYLSQFKNVKC